MTILIQPWTVIYVYYAQGQASDPKFLLENTIALNRRVDFKQREKIVHYILFSGSYKMFTLCMRAPWHLHCVLQPQL